MVLRTKKPHKTGERYAVRGVEEMKGRRGEKNPPPTPRLGRGRLSEEGIHPMQPSLIPHCKRLTRPARLARPARLSLCPVPCALCPAPCAPCPAPCTLCPAPRALRPVLWPCAPCPVPCALYSAPCALCPVPLLPNDPPDILPCHRWYFPVFHFFDYQSGCFSCSHLVGERYFAFDGRHERLVDQDISLHSYVVAPAVAASEQAKVIKMPFSGNCCSSNYYREKGKYQ